MLIDEYWWVPVLIRRKNPKARPQMLERHMRTTRKRMIRDFIDASYSGKYDWNYRRKLGWRATKIRILGPYK